VAYARPFAELSGVGFYRKLNGIKNLLAFHP
jgi:hypothetical protein